MTITVDVPDSLPPDLKVLALLLLKGDESAARPAVDAFLENCKGGSRITPTYVDSLEDLLRDFRRGWDGTEFNYRYFKCEQVARSLGRMGLS